MPASASPADSSGKVRQTLEQLGVQDPSGVESLVAELRAALDMDKVLAT